MHIKRVELEDFLVFSGEFSADFCPGVNVLIGGNGTGKTTLLKLMYIDEYGVITTPTAKPPKADIFYSNGDVSSLRYVRDGDAPMFSWLCMGEWWTETDCVYIPEKDILEHARGLLTFIEQKETGFGGIYRDVLIAAQDIPTKEQSQTQKSVGEKISAIIGGEVRWDKGDGSFYTLKMNGNRIPFVNEASGYKKLGFLGLLLASGRLEPDSVLFWDEPENSLNPELMSKLVEILLDLAKSGVQIFIATHSYNLARYFDVREDKSVPHNMTKSDAGQIVCCSETEYIKLPDNLLESASADLFEAVVADAMGVSRDE